MSKPNLRNDGTEKGTGWLGVLKRPDGKESTEIAIGVEIGGKEVEIPTLIPGLDQSEIDYLLNNSGREMFKTPMGKQIMDKAYTHAEDRIKKGLSPFKNSGGL